MIFRRCRKTSSTCGQHAEPSRGWSGAARTMAPIMSPLGRRASRANRRRNAHQRNTKTPIALRLSGPSQTATDAISTSNAVHSCHSCRVDRRLGASACISPRRPGAPQAVPVLNNADVCMSRWLCWFTPPGHPLPMPKNAPRPPNKKPPHISVWGFGIKSLAVSYSHMIESHYHRR